MHWPIIFKIGWWPWSGLEKNYIMASARLELLTSWNWVFSLTNLENLILFQVGPDIRHEPVSCQKNWHQTEAIKVPYSVIVGHMPHSLFGTVDFWHAHGNSRVWETLWSKVMKDTISSWDIAGLCSWLESSLNHLCLVRNFLQCLPLSYPPAQPAKAVLFHLSRFEDRGSPRGIPKTIFQITSDFSSSNMQHDVLSSSLELMAKSPLNAVTKPSNGSLSKSGLVSFISAVCHPPAGCPLLYWASWLQVHSWAWPQRSHSFWTALFVEEIMHIGHIILFNMLTWWPMDDLCHKYLA